MVAGPCNLSYVGGWGRRIVWTREAEIAVSQDWAIVLQPRQQEWNSNSTNKTKQKANIKLDILTLKKGLIPWKCLSLKTCTAKGASVLVTVRIQHEHHSRCGWLLAFDISSRQAGQRRVSGYCSRALLPMSGPLSIRFHNHLGVTLDIAFSFHCI